MSTKIMDARMMPDIKPINTYDEADRALLELGKIDAALTEKESALNAEIQSLRERYELQTAELRQCKAMLESTLEKFVLSNKNEFESTRSRELMHGIIGLRWSPPKIAILNRKYNLKTALELLKKVKWGKQYIRTKEEVDKDALLAARAANDIDDSKLAAVGLKIDSTENFYYQINWDSITS